MGRRSTFIRGTFVALLVPVCVECGRSELEVDVPTAAGVADAPAIDTSTTVDASVPDVVPDVREETVSTDASSPDAGDAAERPEIGAPRLVGPLSTATVTSQTPFLRWVLPAGETGAEIDICRDRACTTRVTTFMADGASAEPPVALAQGVYFWRARGVIDGVVGTANSPVWEMFVGVRSAIRNTSWGTTLDVNGDGFADVIVGAPNISGNSESAYVYLGGMSGLSSTPITLTYPEHPNGYYRDPVASAGDIDGDGFADVVIGAPDLKTNTGVVLVYSGGPLGLSTTPKTLAAPADVDGSFGWSVTSAGDINGDGYADVLVGAPYTNTNQGAAFVYYGSATGLSTPPTKLVSVGLAPKLFAYYGRAVVGAGDLDGDGFADIAIGAVQGQTLFVYYGGTAGLSPPVLVPQVHAPESGTQNAMFGATLASGGDVNGDGFADLLVGAQEDGNEVISGAAYLFFGSTTGLVKTPIALALPTAATGAAFGSLVSGAGDIDGDGYADLLAATVTDSYVYLGGPAGPAARPTLLVVPGGENNAYGYGALAGGGDVDGDGFADVLVGSPWSNGWVGGAYIYMGSKLGTGSPIPIAHPEVANGIFGTSLY